MGEPVRVLGIAGSPRRSGNTEVLLDEALRGASSEGALVKTLVLCNLNIAPCRHCGGCDETGVCIVDDDMQMVHNELRSTDHLILASPIFFMGVTAQTKAMIDRCQALWVMKYCLKLPVAANRGRERRGLFISVGGRGEATLFEGAIATVKSFLATIDMKYAGQLLYPRVDETGAIRNHPSALKDAFSAGRKLAQG
ncbi:MAG: Multimeric flavodoxin WrbA [Dehalococcoidia bacterium]|nr:Multimeric flavodoxin WrbA [Dehalococcoidia bacterium]